MKNRFRFNKYRMIDNHYLGLVFGYTRYIYDKGLLVGPEYRISIELFYFGIDISYYPWERDLYRESQGY